MTIELTGAVDGEVADGKELATVDRLVQAILTLGLDGVGKLKSAQAIADEHLAQHRDVDVAIDRIVATHARLVAATGFATGLGGLIVMPVTVPTDVTIFYAMTARCVGAIAHLRGYDISSDEVRSVVLLSLLGAGGAGVATKFGAQIGNKTALAALKKLPGRSLTAINRAVGFRLITKFGTKGVINLSKLVPVVGGGVGAGVNVAGLRTAARYAKANFATS